MVTLDGSGSSAPRGGALTYDWSLTSVPKEARRTCQSSVGSCNLHVRQGGPYVVSLVVTDSSGAQSTPDATNVTVTPTQPSNTTLTAQASTTDLYLGDQASISGRLVDADGNGIRDETISFATQARVLVFTTDYPMNDTKTDSTGAFTQSEPVTRHDAPSFITNVDFEA